MTFDEIRPGLKGEVSLVVGEEHTARHLGSGGAKVLATPQMVLLMERAGVAAVDPLLPDGYRTVGARVDVRHLAPTPVGFQVKATAELIEVQGRHLIFHVQADDGTELIGEGTHERVIIDVQNFAERVAHKSK
jgi:fluoroacetyl-CoA thioesterase